MSKPPPPAPTHLLRSHSANITALYITDDNERIYSGDATGKVVVSSTRTLRPIAVWNPHSDSILGVEEFGTFMITHARDNKLHVWNRVQDSPADLRIGGSATTTSESAPTLAYSMDVNALNYCRFSLLQPPAPAGVASSTPLIALPNLVDSSTADVWDLPNRDRLHAAIGQEGGKPIFNAKPTTGRGTAGIIMSMHLYLHPSPDPTLVDLRLLCAYENGSVTLRRYAQPDRPKSIEGQGWEVVWTSKSHVETVMAMAVSRDNTFALTVSADHLINRYDLSEPENQSTVCSVHRTKIPGNSCITIHDGGRVCAVGGWDGNIRLFSAKSLKPLGTLKYHNQACQALSFAHQGIDHSDHKEGSAEEEDDEEDLDDTDKETRSRWLVAGSKDNRVSIWALMNFANS